MELDEWIKLNEQERSKVRNDWNDNCNDNWSKWGYLLDESIVRFKKEYGSLPRISLIVPGYGPDETNGLENILQCEPHISVITTLTSPDVIEEIPSRYAHFTVKQIPYGDTKNAYLRLWVVLLSELIGWDKEKVIEWAQENHAEDLQGNNLFFDHELPHYYIAHLIIPKNILYTIDDTKRENVLNRIRTELANKGKDPLNKSDYNWDSVRTRIKTILHDFNISPHNVK